MRIAVVLLLKKCKHCKQCAYNNKSSVAITATTPGSVYRKSASYDLDLDDKNERQQEYHDDKDNSNHGDDKGKNNKASDNDDNP